MSLMSLAGGSLSNRRVSVALTVATIAISIALLVLVEQMRSQVREGFYRSVSGVDLIVGAPTSPVQLLLLSVFGIGNPSDNVDWSAYREIADGPGVDWSIPLLLGDTHGGFRVVGTSDALFEHYRYAGGRPLAFARGEAFDALFDVVLGAQVAGSLSHSPGDELVLAHGGGNVSLHDHDALPFTVSGVLAPTGTPMDQTLFVRLDAHHALHVGWETGMPRPGTTLSAEEAHEHAHDDDLAPDEVSAFLLGLETRAAALGMQYRINRGDGEPLLAILPGIALQQLWRITGFAERILRVVAALVVVAGLMGMLTTLISTLNERRREMAILRACGARPWQISALLLLEAALIGLAGILVGIAIAFAAQAALAPWLLARFGVAVSMAWPATWQWLVLAGIWVAAVLVALVPAAMVYRRTLADGMQVRQ
ncbi:MAG: FtsX-like permease family protein [Candidatus Wenzhouxiangella sp. M2_3B_020]